jgi:biopolymer transport protein ExbB/TolQ
MAELGHFFEQGGYGMYPLVVCSVLAALKHALLAPDRIRAVADNALSLELAAIEPESRTLRTVLQLTTLIGLLGTVVGLCGGYQSVCMTGAHSRQAALAQSISEAMCCTALGLAISIASLAALAFLRSRADRLRDELPWITQAIVNRVVEHHSRLRIHGERRALLPLHYRTTAEQSG